MAGWPEQMLLTKISALALFFALLAVPAAANTQLVMPPGPAADLYSQWVAESLVPTVNADVRVMLRDCRAYGGGACIDTYHKPFRIYYDDFAYLSDVAAYGPDDIAKVRLGFMHELGHALDFTLNGRGPHGQRYRRIFARLVGASVREDWQIGDTELFEKFAMAYAYCSAYPTAIPWHVINRVYWGYDYNPKPATYARTCAMLRGLR